MHGNGMSYTPKTDFSSLSDFFDKKPRIPEDPDTSNFEFLSNKDLLKKLIILTFNPDNVQNYIETYKKGIDPFYIELEQLKQLLRNPK